MRAFNLIPADARAGAGVGAGKSGGGAYVVLGVLGVLAIFALLYGKASHQISSERGEVATLTAEAQRAQAQAARLAPYKSFAALREQRTQAVNQLVDSRFDWAHAFHELGRVLPVEASLSTISGTIGSTTGAATPTPAAATPASGATASTAVASATPPGSVPTFTLSGCATSQAAVALTLERLRLIDGVKEATLQSSTATTGGSGAGSGGSGNCPAGGPVFAMQIAFEPLPSASAALAASAAPKATPAADTATPTGGTR